MEDVAAQMISSGVAYLWRLVSEAGNGGLFSVSSQCRGKELQVESFLAQALCLPFPLHTRHHVW